jgi:predicted ATPase
MNKVKRVLLIGGPGTGKTSVLKVIEKNGFYVHHEISREVTAAAKNKGIEQLFLTDPFAFSNHLLSGRIEQFNNAQKGINFYDRGIPDVPAYHIFTGDEIPDCFIKASREYIYDTVFFFPPWQQIYTSDNERYENYHQSVKIGNILKDFYIDMGYKLISVPKLKTVQRFNFINDYLK